MLFADFLLDITFEILYHGNNVSGRSCALPAPNANRFSTMKLHLNLSLRRALLAALAAFSSLSYTASAGMVDTRYDLQYYMDFARNKGMFGVGATNIAVYYKDGTSVQNPVIPIMPNLDGYGQKMAAENMHYGVLMGFGGCGLITPQFTAGAAHVGENPVLFLTEDGNISTVYYSSGYKTYVSDVEVQRLNKIVTEVAYTPMADDAFMKTLRAGDWLWRLGDGHQYNSAGEIVTSLTGSNTLGGIVGVDSVSQGGGKDWLVMTNCRQNDWGSDLRTPLDIGLMFGDSGSPLYAWDAANERFVFVVACSAGTTNAGFNNMGWLRSNPTRVQEGMDSFTVVADQFSGTETIIWSAQDATTGKGTLTQGDVSVTYTGKGSSNTDKNTLGLTFSTSDTENVQTLELQASVNMGAGAMTFDSGKWKLTEKDAASTFNSAGFIVNKGAELTLELTATSAEEWRKVGEGIMTIAGSGDNEAVLRVGGGTTQYNVTYDDDGNISGCTLGNAGETRLDRTGGYAASSVRLEGGVAILVLMQDGQFKTNSVAGDTFTFGNEGGLLNLNGHDLSWGVINQQGSGAGARIGNFTPQGEQTPGLATFTYTGTGTFSGCFMDEGSGEGKAQLAVKYNNAENGVWTLTGNHSNAGGFTVEAGTMKLQGSLTPHVHMTDRNDWTYATLSGSDVTVKSGATFQLSHHALMTGNVNVEEGGSFVINQTVNAVSESIVGSKRQDMAQLGITSLIGNVVLNGTANMTVDTESPVVTRMQGNITNNYSKTLYNFASFTKTGSGIFELDGKLQIPRGTVQEGGLVVGNADGFIVDANWSRWTIQEKGFLAVEGLDNATLLRYVDGSSSGVLALTSDQETQLNLTNHKNLIIGAWGNVNYGSAETELSTVTDATYGEVWRLGGGTGTLTVNFKLTGEADLLIGNEWSSGTVHLTNTANDFTGDIYMLGSGNKLTYVDGALGTARVNLTYGNALALYDASQMDIIKDGASGVLAVGTNDSLDLSKTSLSLGANGEYTYSGALTVGDMYRFGGSGQLTVDTELDGTKSMEIDGQGTTGSSVTFARENAFSGSIVAGGGLHLAEPNSAGDISIHVGHEEALAKADSIRLQNGAVLYTDGGNMTVNNLTLESGSALRNNGATNSLVLLNVSEGVSTALADGVLDSTADTAALHLVKGGKGTLSMATNSSWSGGLTIGEGKVTASITATGNTTSAGGIGSTNNAIYVAEGGTLSLTGAKRTGWQLGGTCLPQTVTGTGTVEFSTGGAALFSVQGAAFEGTLKLMGNTRLYVGTNLTTDSYYMFQNNKNVVNNATIDIESGSQVRIGSGLRYLKDARVSLNTDFVISGDGFKGSDSGLVHSGCNAGALSIDGDSTVYGDITLKDDASIASWSAGQLLTSVSQWQACTTGSANASYALKNHLGGTVRGRILGEGKTLTVRGNEGMTFTADSSNTFGNLVIANGNGQNDDKFALRLNGGKAVNQTSTALGMGEVTLNGGLILRLAGTGVADNTNVVYTYANDITAGDNATLQSYNITNRLTGTVSMSGSTLNLATANGGVLELVGGLDGSGTLNVGAASVISLGGAVATQSAESPQFSGSIVAGAGADISLAASSVLSSSTSIVGAESLTLRLGGAGDYTLGGISGASALTLHFDFTNTPTAGDADTWATLSSSIAADTTTIALDLNLFSDIETGNYTLISSAGSGTTYQLADNMNGRLNLVTNDAGALVLTVDADNRLYWRTGGSGSWNTTDANWYSDAAAGSTTFSRNDNVMLDATGVAQGNSSAARETISLSDTVEVGTMGVQDAAYELTGAGAITGKSLVVGNGGDMKLSNAGGSTFTEGVVVNDAALTVAGNTVTADVRAEAGGQFSLQNGAALSGNLTISDAEASISQSTLAGDVTAKGSGKLVLESAAVSGAHQLRFEDAGVLSASSGATLSGTFTFASGQTVLQSEGMSISGGTLSSAAALEVDTLAMSGASLTLTHAAGTTTQIGSITGNGSLVKDAAGNLRLGSASLSGLTMKGGGTSDISGKVTVSGHFSLGKGTVNLVDGADVTVGQYTSGNTADSQPTQLSIGTGASLTVTGNNDVDDTNASLLLAHWKQSASYLLLNGGTLNARNTSMLMGWDSGATFEATAGTANLKGIRFSAQRSNSESFILGSAESGTARINLGSAGISGIGTNDKVQLGNGTIGATADFTISGGSVQMVATTGSTVFDTSGHRITVSSTLSGSGNISKQGEGTLLISGSGSAYSGNIAVNAGALAVDATGKDILSSAASVTVGNGATLDLSELDFTDASNRISVGAGTSISFADTATVAFGSMESGREYGVFDINGGLLDGWSDLSVSNFTIDGVRLSDMGRVELNLGMTGGFSYTLEDGWDLVWNGGESKQTWNQNESNLVWQTTRPDYIGNPVTTEAGYMNNDNVIFNSDANLELEGNIRVNDMTVADNVSLSTTGNLEVLGTLALGKNSTWSFSGDASMSFTEAQLKEFAADNAALVVGEGATLTMTNKETTQNNASTAFNSVSGSGNVVLNLSADNGVGFNFEKINGDITVATGRLQVNTSTFNAASDICLMSSDAQLVFNGKDTELKNDVVLGASTTIHGNSGCTGTISGVISGSGGLTKAGAGSLTFKQQNTYTGVTTISGGKIIIDTAGDYHLMNTVNMTGTGGTLEVAGGTTVYSSANTTHKIATNLRINKGGVFSFDGKGNDHFQANVSGTVTVDGGVLDFGNSCQILRMFTSITLSNGAELKGVGATGTAGYAAAMEFNNDSTINVTAGDNTISASTRLNGGNGRTLTYNVGEGATLNVTGRIHADSDSALGNITKSGVGKATLSARTMLNKVVTGGGEISVAYTGNDGNTIGILDGSNNGAATGSLRLKKDARLNVSSQLWGRSQSSVVLEQGAALTHGDVTFSNKGTTDATLKTSSNNSQYTVGAADWSLTKGHLTAASDSEMSLGTQLVNSSVENAGSGKLTVSHANNSITGVYASAGDMAVMQQDAGLNLDELVVASQKTVSAYTGTEAVAAAEANVTVSKRAEFGAGAVLNANLTLAAGATLEVGVGGLTMGSTLTLNQGLTLGTDTLSRVQGLSVGESATLFSGVDGLTLGKTSYTTITTEDSMLASPWFTNLTGDQYVLTYTGTDNGSLSITMMSAAVPEPTTATLSLLALAALAARRRRK